MHIDSTSTLSSDPLSLIDIYIHTHIQHSVQWHPHLSHILASISHDGQLRLWDTRATKPLHTLAAHQGKALALAFDGEKGEKIYTGGEDGVVRSFDMKVDPTSSEASE